MSTDFTFWLMQQPKEVQFLYYTTMVIVLIICMFYSLLQEHKEDKPS